MKRETWIFITTELERNFSRKFAPDGIRKISDEMLRLPESVGEKIFDVACLNFTALPPPGKLLEIARDEAKKIAIADAVVREERAREEKRNAPDIFKTPANSGLAKNSLFIVRGILSLNREAPDLSVKCNLLLQAMSEMAKSYPHLQWHKTYLMMRDIWREKGFISQ